ncbi:PHP domain-containing protein [Candidatus Desantisbacteria bacterium]|nr:PHP domain-containing protein [Candidatus Desantisbacteria bacterium]
MLIDLHIHTVLGSPCSVIEINDIIKMAKRVKLDGVCITDHHSRKAIELMKEKAAGHNLLILGGMEVRSLEGDVLTFGFSESVKEGIPLAELIPWVHSLNGVVIAAHPFRSGAPSMGNKIYEIKDIDAIEVLNGNSSEDMNILSWLASLKLGIPGVGGSDAHTALQIGKYATFFDKEIKNEDDFICALKGGRFQAMKMF